MSKKRIGYIATVLIILAAVTAALCVFLTLRSRNNDEGQEGTEQESAVLPEESDLELPPEIETVSVETDDAVSELYRALELALTDAEDCMEDVVTSLTRSAELGNSDAMYFLGEIYFQGIGVEADLEKAGACLRQACDSGNRKAMPLYAIIPFILSASAAVLFTTPPTPWALSFILFVILSLDSATERIMLPIPSMESRISVISRSIVMESFRYCSPVLSKIS